MSAERENVAERERTLGHLDAAIGMSQHVMGQAPYFPLFIDKEKQTYLKGARIYVGAQMSRVTRSWRAREAADNLRKARDGITHIYKNQV